MTRLFRAMRAESDGLPAVGPSARTLGVRPGIDVLATAPGDTVSPATGGLSVSPDDPLALPSFRRPPAFGGTGKDPVWYLDVDDLGTGLAFRPDPSRSGHGFIEPAVPMTLDQFDDGLLGTRPFWKLVASPSSSGSNSGGS
jgi:hypothetical protein